MHAMIQIQSSRNVPDLLQKQGLSMTKNNFAKN